MSRWRRFRLWRARWFGPRLGEWVTDRPAMRGGHYCAWRLISDGTYQYRVLTDAEANDYMQGAAW